MNDTFCPNCGTINEKGSNFCSNCSQELESDITEETEVLSKADKQNVPDASAVSASDLSPEPQQTTISTCEEVPDGNTGTQANESAPLPINYVKASSKTVDPVHRGKSKKMSTSNMILLGVMSVITLALFLAIALVGSKSSDENFDFNLNDLPAYTSDDNTSYEDDSGNEDSSGGEDDRIDGDYYDDFSDDFSGNDSLDNYDEDRSSTYFVTDYSDYRIFVRNGPDKDNSIIMTIEAGDTSVSLKYLKEENNTYDSEEGQYFDWYKVSTPDGQTGWVRSDVVRIK